MEKRSRKCLKLDTPLANNYQEDVDEVHNVTNSKHGLNPKREHQQNFNSTGNTLDIDAIIKLYNKGEYTQEMLDQVLSVQERFIYFHLSETKLDRAISFLFKSELTKVIDIRKADYENYKSALMNYYKKAPIVFPQILAQLCPNILEFRKMNLPSDVAFLNEYKHNIPKYKEPGPKNKFSAYMDRFVHTMPHLIEIIINKIGVDGVDVMMKAFGCEQATVDSIFNLVKEFKIKIDDTYFTNKQRNQKIEETIALLLKCPNTKTVDISLVKDTWNSPPIVKFFKSMPSSFTQAFAQLCPRIEQITHKGDLIFDTQLLESYARGTNGRCNMSHVNLLYYDSYSKMQRQHLQYYVDFCHKIKSLQISFNIVTFLIKGQSIEQNKSLLDKLKHVEDMKISGYCPIDIIDFVKQFMVMFTELKHLDLQIYGMDTYIVREIITTINSLPSLACLDLDVYDTYCLYFIRPSLTKNLSVSVIRPEEMNLFTNLYNLQSLTLIIASDNIIPIVSQLKWLVNLKHLKVKYFYGDYKQLFSAAIVLSQNIKFDFHDRGMKSLRDVIDARDIIFNKINLIELYETISDDHVILHEAVTKLDTSRVRCGISLLLNKSYMKIVQQCCICKLLLLKNTIFNIEYQ